MCDRCIQKDWLFGEPTWVADMPQRRSCYYPSQPDDLEAPMSKKRDKENQRHPEEPN